VKMRGVKLGKDILSSRKGGGGSMFYLEGWRAVANANRIFGYNGWCTKIVEITQGKLHV